ncbi:hypothetical protein CYMTET_15747 [Cymbomonas tetramitiformis]|uniref:Uncharacterized protein n=1 Tax=Cymbomonas tetramitiformis TaxID=36881 RepID=A0AAE0GDX7_9CHLO|nr:hypothetical protein CYMTET_15747 [Cymbomonas tetramitiformis]
MFGSVLQSSLLKLPLATENRRIEERTPSKANEPHGAGGKSAPLRPAREVTTHDLAVVDSTRFFGSFLSSEARWGRRQSVWTAALACVQSFSLKTPQAADAETEEEDPWAGSYVKPALTVGEYLQEIQLNRKEAIDSMLNDVDMGRSQDLYRLSGNLLVAPFDDVRQSIFYLPWALVKEDGEAGLVAQKHYLVFMERLRQLDRTVLDAARYQAEEKDVIAAIRALDQSIDDFVCDIPQKYMT